MVVACSQPWSAPKKPSVRHLPSVPWKATGTSECSRTFPVLSPLLKGGNCCKCCCGMISLAKICKFCLEIEIAKMFFPIEMHVLWLSPVSHHPQWLWKSKPNESSWVIPPSSDETNTFAASPSCKMILSFARGAKGLPSWKLNISHPSRHFWVDDFPNFPSLDMLVPWRVFQPLLLLVSRVMFRFRYHTMEVPSLK